MTALANAPQDTARHTIASVLYRANWLLMDHEMDGYSVRTSPRMTRTLGHFNPNTRTIVISEAHIEAHSYEEVEDTILHELAHALMHRNHPGVRGNHGPLFMRYAREVGAKQKARASVQDPRTPARGYYGTWSNALGRNVRAGDEAVIDGAVAVVSKASERAKSFVIETVDGKKLTVPTQRINGDLRFTGRVAVPPSFRGDMFGTLFCPSLERRLLVGDVVTISIPVETRRRVSRSNRFKVESIRGKAVLARGEDGRLYRWANGSDLAMNNVWESVTTA